MKPSTVTLLGLCFLLALISSTQGGKGKKGGKKMKCDGMKHDESDKEIWKKCGGGDKKDADGASDDEGGEGGGEGGDGGEGGGGGGGGGWGGGGGGGGKGGKGKGKGKWKKMGACMMKEKGIVKDQKLQMDAYNDSVDKKFDTSEAAAAVKAEFKKCCDKDGLAEKTYATDDDFGKLSKCAMKSMMAGCKNKKKDEGQGS